MTAGRPEWLRGLSDEELLIVAAELEARAEQFDAATRSLMNDELRRRKMPTLGFGKSRL